MKHLKKYNKFSILENTEFIEPDPETLLEECLEFFRNKYSTNVEGDIFQSLSDDILNMFEVVSKSNKEKTKFYEVERVNRSQSQYLFQETPPFGVRAPIRSSEFPERCVAHDFNFSNAYLTYGGKSPRRGMLRARDWVEGYAGSVCLFAYYKDSEKFFLGKKTKVDYEIHFGFIEQKRDTSVWYNRYTIGEIIEKDGKKMLQLDFEQLRKALEEIFSTFSLIS